MKLKLQILIPIALVFMQFAKGQSLAPNSLPPKVSATRALSKISIDGNLNEPDWQNAPVIKSFKQVEPYQGTDARFDTEVKILFDDKNIYFGAFAKDSSKSNIRVQDLSRDFSFEDNDLFGIAIDPFNNKRNAIAFQVTPYGTQRDLQSFDDFIFDLDWDGLWYAKTNITDNGWYAEIAIPFQSIRYPNNDISSWGINFIRIRRSTNEITAFPGFPRSFDTYRMTYVAELANLKTPKSKTNIRLNPYVLEQAINKKDNTESGTNYKTKIGGDVKWAVSQNAVIDATFNTDFAQADVDRQVVNLSRFSVYFPERRQFFLENSGLFITGDNENIEPFFSRRIGLDDNGNAIPLLVGAKYTDRTVARSIGALYALQDSHDSIAKTSFSILRYIKNYGNANNIGVMFTNKYTSSNEINTVGAINGLHRIGEKWRLKYLYSYSFDRNHAVTQSGNGANINIDYSSNTLFFTSNHSLISESYLPAIGFVSRGNLLTHNTGIIPVLRPKWKPKFMRSFQPGVFVNTSQRASDLTMQEGALSIYPVYLYFNNGSLLTFRYQYSWQFLTSDFDLLNTTIDKGRYYYNRYRVKFNSDLSKKISIATGAEIGSYFDGNLRTFSAELRLIPSPKIALISSYELNQLKGIGNLNSNVNTHLFTSTLRLALNPNVQLVSFYQYNSFASSSRVNIRFSWQYKPLSFIYLVFNISNNHNLNLIENQGLFKINFLKQLN